MAFLKKLSKINKKTKLIVHCWIRDHERTLKLHNTPEVIITIVILFYRMGDASPNDYSAYYNIYGINEILSTLNGV